MSWLKKFFNSETVSGRANVAKATYASFLLMYIVHRMRRKSSAKGSPGCDSSPQPAPPARPGCGCPPHEDEPAKPRCDNLPADEPVPVEPEKPKGGCSSEPTGQAAGKEMGDQKWSCDFEL